MPTKKEQKIAELDKLIGISNEMVEAQEKELPEPSVNTEVEENEIAEVEDPARELAVMNDQLFQEDLKNDYYETRKTLKDLIKKGEQALTGIIAVANEGEAPRAYEVVSTLMKTISDVSTTLLELQKSVRALQKGPAGEGGGRGGSTTPGVPNESDTPVVIVASFQEMVDMMNVKKEEGKFEGSIVNDDGQQT